MAEPDFRGLEITVVGLGLIGGSFAKAIRKLSPKNLWAVDIDKKVLELAKSTGVIDEGYLSGEIPLRSSDLVVICVYPELTSKFIKDNMDNFRQGAVITDAAGIKTKVLNEVRMFLRNDLDFVGGHPLAGKEGSGFSKSSADIFLGANYLITPVVTNQEKSLILVEEMVKGIGCRQPVRMDPAKHDEIIALTSQLPHIIAAALMNCSQSDDTGLFIGGSFKDATRVAQINVELWSKLLMENRENTLTQIELFLENIGKIKQMLQEEDNASLEEYLRSAGKAKARLTDND
ncbi:MAG: prephenate dehydrogenase [Gracilibacter sp. BRH_c7a]|nr:MAG: prephenate dehydrogenase [Gracilibacter sp. BRH_c7a]